MLPDPLIVSPILIPQAGEGGTPFYAFSVNNTNGVVNRTGDMTNLISVPSKVKVTISHSTSSENKPITTDRSLIRIDVTQVAPVDPLVDPTASVYVVFAQPRAVYSRADMVAVFRHLIGLVLFEDTSTTLDGARLMRILNGEG
jgi:hypothetical protein